MNEQPFDFTELLSLLVQARMVCTDASAKIMMSAMDATEHVDKAQEYEDIMRRNSEE